MHLLDNWSSMHKERAYPFHILYLWSYRVRTESCCAAGALFSLRSSLKWATGELKSVLTRGIPGASSAEPQLACWSQQWANIHPCLRNHFDFSVVDPRGYSYDPQGFKGTTVQWLAWTMWNESVIIFNICHFQWRECVVHLQYLLCPW